MKITGQIREKETGRGLPNLVVKAFDKDLLYDDLLGAVNTDKDGNFEIVYEGEDYKELFEQKPDIYLKIQTPDRKRTIHTTEDKVRFEAGKKEHFIVDIPKEEIEPEGVIIDFEDKPLGQPIFNQYQNKGVLFPTKPIINKPKAGTHSGTQALISAHLSEEFNPGPLPIVFTAPQKYVKMFVGLAEGASSQTKIVLRAFDKKQGGTIVAQSPTIVLGPGPAAITTPIKVKTKSAIILRVELEYSLSNFEIIDDLQFDTAGPELEKDKTPPVVQIITPENDQIFTLNNPQVFLRFKIVENQFLKRVTVTIIGAETQTEFNVCGDGTSACGGTPPNFEFSFYTAAFYGVNKIIVTAEDFAGNLGFDKRDFTVLPVPSGVKLLILTPKIFLTALLPLVNHKNSTGMPSTILTLESIYNDSAYLTGRDQQEKIKLAIAKAHKTWGIKYVMLVGDVDQFPIRYARTWDSVAWGHGFAPSDLYYADLYDAKGNFDDWDFDNDDLFGEMNTGNPKNWAELNQDKVDLKPDIGVGRIPASNINEVQIMVKKIITYEQATSNPATRRIMLVTGNFSNPEPTADYIAQIMDPIGFTSIKHYWTTDWTTIPDTDPQWFTKRSGLLNGEMDKGANFVAYLGHGFGGSPGTTGGNGGGWAGWYGYQSVVNLNNSNKLPVVLAAACDTAMFHFPHYPYEKKTGGEYKPSAGIPNNQRNAPEPAAVQPSKYDLDTMAEHFLVKSNVGAIAYIGAYTGIQPACFKIIQRFFEEFVALGGSAILGDVWAGGVKRYITSDFSDIPNYWGKWYSAAIFHHIQKVMLFGDPSLRIS
ncbi:MAG: C25 family cysteine peptidase [Candidatus Hodarchaeota archaeon]